MVEILKRQRTSIEVTVNPFLEDPTRLEVTSTLTIQESSLAVSYDDALAQIRGKERWSSARALFKLGITCVVILDGINRIGGQPPLPLNGETLAGAAEIAVAIFTFKYMHLTEGWNQHFYNIGRRVLTDKIQDPHSQ